MPLPRLKTTPAARRVAKALIAEYLARDLGSPCPEREWSPNLRWLATAIALLADPTTKRQLRDRVLASLRPRAARSRARRAASSATTRAATARSKSRRRRR